MKIVAARVNVWLAPTNKGMRTNYSWTQDPKIIELADKVGWFAITPNGGNYNGLQLLELMKETDKLPAIGFEFFGDNEAEVNKLVDFAVANFPSDTFINKSTDMGESWKVIQ